MTSPVPLHRMNQSSPVRLAQIAPPTPEPQGDRFLNVGEVADMLRVSKMSVYRLVNETHDLRAVQVGRSIRIYESAVKAFLRRAEIGR